MDKYITPKMDVKEFVRESILTASGGGTTCGIDKVVTPGLCDTEGLLICTSDTPTCNDAW